MKRHLSIITVPILLFSMVLSVPAPGVKYSVDMTIRHIAHDVGLKGRELAELLGLEGSVDNPGGIRVATHCPRRPRRVSASEGNGVC